MRTTAIGRLRDRIQDLEMELAQKGRDTESRDRCHADQVKHLIDQVEMWKSNTLMLGGLFEILFKRVSGGYGI